jgi:hypothetical protein
MYRRFGTLCFTFIGCVSRKNLTYWCFERSLLSLSSGTGSPRRVADVSGTVMSSSSVSSVPRRVIDVSGMVMPSYSVSGVPRRVIDVSEIVMFSSSVSKRS